MTLSKVNIDNNNEALEVEMNLLRRENEELKKQIEEAKKITGFVSDESFDYVISRISIRNPFTFYETIVIPHGKNQGIKSGMAVVTKNGLLGRIDKVNKNSSTVNLITKPNNDISVIVHGVYGILSGYSRELECLQIRNLNNYDLIEIGDLVYTSTFSELPGGILIGRVMSIDVDRHQIEKKICVESKVDLDNINYVAIIKKELLQ